MERGKIVEEGDEEEEEEGELKWRKSREMGGVSFMFQARGHVAFK